jgi:hypothetical protein
MSKSQVKSALKKEIREVNKAIDYKIIKGLPYAGEAQKHRILRARLGLLNKHTFLARTMRVAHMFVL